MGNQQLQILRLHGDQVPATKSRLQQQKLDYDSRTTFVGQLQGQLPAPSQHAQPAAASPAAAWQSGTCNMQHITTAGSQLLSRNGWTHDDSQHVQPAGPAAAWQPGACNTGKNTATGL
jgi:hypothetical protein